MTTARVDVQLADSSMTDIIDRREHCWMDPELAASLGISVGHQVRVIRNSDQYALYTVSSLYQDGPDDDDIRMGLRGRQRLATDSGFSAMVDTEITHPTYTDTEAIAYGDFVERLIDPAGAPSSIVVCAPHGGMIERYTDQQAEAMAAAAPLAAHAPVVWSCRGWSTGEAYDRWHITSTDINPASFPKLGMIASRGFRYAVSFHGKSGSETILVGGAASRLTKVRVKTRLDALLPANYQVRIPGGGGLDGSDPANFVNWLTASGAGGIQIEQTMDARRDHGMAIAEVLADLFASLI